MNVAEREVAACLIDATGIDPYALDTRRLRWIIESRCRHLQLDLNATAYADHLKSSSEELQAMIDAVLIQETRFFRDPTVFNHLGQWLPRMAADFSGELRILSAPCSTGQEAYSIGAILQQAGVPLSRFVIDAFDLSLTALATARQGVYPEEALRHVPADLQRLCGSLRDKHWTIHQELRERVSFERRNLANADALSATPQYHLILCRNLFIYLRSDARAKLARSLASALIPGGRLILGSADRVEEVSALFSPQKPAASFAFTHRQSTASFAEPPPQTRSTSSKAVRSTKPLTTAPAVPATPATAAELYLRAKRHQEQHQLRQAERACRQALYLDSNYLPALELLAAVWRHHKPPGRLRLALEARINRVSSSSIRSTVSSTMDGESAKELS